MQSANKRIAKNTVFLYSRTIIIMLISLYTSRVILDVLGESDFGIYNLVGGIVLLFSFMNYAMSSATQRYLSYEIGRDDNVGASRVFNTSILIHIGIVVIVLILGETLGLWFVTTQLNIPDGRENAAFWVYQLSLLGCCASILRIPYNACIIAYEEMSFYAYVSIIEAVLRLLIVFVLLVCNNDLLIWYAILMLAVILIVNAIYYVYCYIKFNSSHLSYYWDSTLFKKLFGFTGWSMFGGAANVGATQATSILLNIFYGVGLNAAIGIANQVNSAVGSFVSNFQTAFTPQIVKTYASNKKDEFILLVSRSSRFSYCLIFIIAVPIMVCINFILRTWLTMVPEYTAEIVNLFIVYCMIDAISGPLWVSVQATGNIRNYQILMSIIILANIPLMYILLVLGLSPIIVVSIRTILNLVTHVVRIFYLKKHLDFPTSMYWRDVMLPLTLMTLLCIPGAIYMSRYSNTLWGAIIAFSLILVQNLALSVWLGIKKSERIAIYNTVKDRILQRKK